MNAKILIHVICNEAMIYLLLYDLHDCAFKGCLQDSLANSKIISYKTNDLVEYLTMKLLILNKILQPILSTWN